MSTKIRVCLVCVCYNAYEDALRFLDSVSKAYAKSSGVDLTVVFGDNSTDSQFERVKTLCFEFNFQCVKNSNIGYFPAFCKGVSTLESSASSFDYVMVSNVDLVLDDGFFVSLKCLETNAEVGIIAPSILSLNHGGDLNPKIITRPTKNKIKFMSLVCSSGFTFLLYNFISSRRAVFRSKKRESSRSFNGKYMYAAHGAFIVFTQAFFKKGGRIDYPRFLFGEEGFVAEEARRAELKIEHVTTLKVMDREHGSTSLKSSSFLASEHKKSYSYFLNNYF